MYNDSTEKETKEGKDLKTKLMKTISEIVAGIYNLKN